MTKPRDDWSAPSSDRAVSVSGGASCMKNICDGSDSQLRRSQNRYPEHSRPPLGPASASSVCMSWMRMTDIAWSDSTHDASSTFSGRFCTRWIALLRGAAAMALARAGSHHSRLLPVRTKTKAMESLVLEPPNISRNSFAAAIQRELAVAGPHGMCGSESPRGNSRL